MHLNKEERLVEILRERRFTITTAESLTGGMIASTLVDVPGASDVLREAYVTYCDEAKQKLVGVRPETLAEHTAVSMETAREMAEGSLAAAGADLALSATGLAGPDGGTAKRPVGLVYIGCCLQGKTTVEELRLTGNRSEIRRQTTERALALALKCLEQES